jgi:hypothetical protein
VDVPETRYARSGDVNIAAQVSGDGPFDLVHIPPLASHAAHLVAGSGTHFAERGIAELKGVPSEWRLFAVEQV